MLTIVISSGEDFDEEKQVFVQRKGWTIQLEHSLLSISKWESKWHQPFLSTIKKSNEQMVDYIRCMTVTPNVDSTIYTYLTQENIDAIDAYINDPMTATVFNDTKRKTKSVVITSEMIYYWMIASQIPSEYQKWHLNRLMVLIEICARKAKPTKKTDPAQQSAALARQASLNEARKKALKTKG